MKLQNSCKILYTYTHPPTLLYNYTHQHCHVRLECAAQHREGRRGHEKPPRAKGRLQRPEGRGVPADHYKYHHYYHHRDYHYATQEEYRRQTTYYTFWRHCWLEVSDRNVPPERMQTLALEFRVKSTEYREQRTENRV